MIYTNLELVASVIFLIAIVHTFLVHKFQHLAHRHPEGSVGENFFHLIGEVEVVFGFWAGIFLLIFVGMDGSQAAIRYLEGRNFTEPSFVFVIMVLCGSRPILKASEAAIEGLARLLPLKRQFAFYLVALGVGPLFGSFITEPAAMTVIALLLLDRYYSQNISQKLKYATLGLLFVNVSIGGTLTPFAAPPVLMVAETWSWDLNFMFSNFGWKAAISCLISATAVAFCFRKEIEALNPVKTETETKRTPLWVYGIHLATLALIVTFHSTYVVFWGVFLFFLGVFTVTQEYQSPLKLREGLLVAFFLGGLVVLGGLQSWWLTPVLTGLNSLTLYFGAMGLTAVTDNAALTYLGSQVEGISDLSKYALVAGAVVGGGLTVIANAPNPAGYGILNKSFNDGISPLGLFVSALPPTIVAGIIFWIF